MRASLILTTYKNPPFLEMCLASVARQKAEILEVLVAEDGSDPHNLEVISQARAAFPFPLHHLTQKDTGNRKPLIMNKAVLMCQGDYIVFIDGDCLLRSDFVSEHLKRADPKAFLTGRRVELSKKASEIIDLKKIKAGFLDRWAWELYADAIWGDTQRLGRFFKCPEFLRKLFKQNSVLDIRGCNLSLYKEALFKINGFNNHFSGAYGEDSDAEYRLKFEGYEMRSVKGAAIQLHLWHPSQAKDPGNQEKLKALLQQKKSWAESGLLEAASIE